ncbi:hypothetical protein C922_02769 [Plasmodium inui San Antonio 1]|uniref:SRR1-like domain-containing protein n=1 Tax=Plasmodium inui San Antonio 1 TaxID=1237626 RepID=W7ACH1_9APIC|nr:hypothetical protein C922_02769 [Plasmodium inui San Antonio 1]EUD66784.1 hypothetical protein C922_02769 [Plasmodium inui San Antonio 1]
MEDWVYVERRRGSRRKKCERVSNHAGRRSGHSSYGIDGTNRSNGSDGPFTEHPPIDQEKQAEKTFSEVKKVMTCLQKSDFFENFHEQFVEAVDKANVHIKCAICLGLGSLADPNWNNKKACLYQLGFVLLLRRIYNVEKVYIYDPKIGEVDRLVCGHFDIEVLSCCEEEAPEVEGLIVEPPIVKPPIELTSATSPEGKKDDKTSHTIAKPSAQERTLVFMPHCDVSLYSQVMHNIYRNEKLSYANVHFLLTLEKTIFLGNSFDYYRERAHMYRPFGIPPYAISMLRSGKKLPKSATQSSLNRLVQFYKMEHFLFYVHKYAREGKFPFFAEHVSAFNDMAIITFGSMPDGLSFWLDVRLGESSKRNARLDPFQISRFSPHNFGRAPLVM